MATLTSPRSWALRRFLVSAAARFANSPGETGIRKKLKDSRDSRNSTRTMAAWLLMPISHGTRPLGWRRPLIQALIRRTWGHSPGGMTYVVTGLARLIAIVGDSLFAGSMGGGNVSYQDALRNNLEKILTLPDETIICPGHGPMTTVGEEKQHNPFFAGKA